jgi:hypothetical protein
LLMPDIVTLELPIRKSAKTLAEECQTVIIGVLCVKHMARWHMSNTREMRLMRGIPTSFKKKIL